MWDEGTIRVQGHGEVRVAPDEAYLILGVHRIDASAQAAVESNSEAVQSVLDALKAAGLPDDAILLSQFNIFSSQPENTYTVSNQISMRLSDVRSVGQILGIAIHAGANVTGGITFGLVDSSEAEADALRRAVDDARSRAETLAIELGVVLGDVVSVNAALPNPNVHAPSFGRRAARSMAAPAEVPIAGGEITIPADVEVVYELRLND